MKERITVINPGDSHDNVVELVTNEAITLLTTPDFLIETRTTAPFRQFEHIDRLRVQLLDSPQLGPDNVFGYNYLSGFSAYALPKLGVDPEAFYTELEVVLEELDDIYVPRERWITTPNAVSFHIAVDDSISERTKAFPPVVDVYFHDGVKITKTVEPSKSKHLRFFKLVDHYTEIGLFLVDRTISSPDDVVLSGLRWVLDPEEKGEQDLFETMFHIKPRHRSLPSTLTTEVVANGLHPVLKTTFDVPQLPAEEDIKECRLYYYAVLSRNFIFDKYQLVPSGGQLVVSIGETNLELPAYKVDQGLEVLFEFPLNHTGPIEFTLHLRYQLPDNTTGLVPKVISEPLLFYGCDVTDAKLLAKSPLDNKRDIGGNYEGYFSEDTVFYHLGNSLTHGIVSIDIPTASSSLASIQFLTTSALAVGVAMILVTLVGKVIRRLPSEKKNQ